MQNRDGTDRADPSHPILVQDEVNYVGDHVAFVVAETRDAGEGRRRADRGRVRGPAGRGGHRRCPGAGAAQVHPEAPGNLAFDWHYGDEAAVQAAFAKAAKVVKLELINNRVICNAMEPRACVAEWDAGDAKLTVADRHPGRLGPPRHRWPPILASSPSRCG